MYEELQEVFMVVQQFAQFGCDTRVSVTLYSKYIEFEGIYKNRGGRKQKTPPKARLQFRDIQQVFYGTHADIAAADIPEYAQKMVKRFVGNRVDTAMDRVRGASVTANPRTVHFFIICYRGKDQIDGLIILKTQSRTALGFVNMIRHRAKLPIPESDMAEMPEDIPDDFPEEDEEEKPEGTAEDTAEDT